MLEPNRAPTPGTSLPIAQLDPMTTVLPKQAAGMVRVWEITATLYDSAAWGSITLNGAYCWRATGQPAGTIAGPIKVVTRVGDTLDVRNHAGVIYWLANCIDIPDWVTSSIRAPEIRESLPAAWPVTSGG